MKEFIFTWDIENISHCWNKKGEAIVSPSFVADTLQNTVWNLRLYPKGDCFVYWLSLYLHRGKDEGPEDFSFNCELAFVSANNLTLTSQVYKRMSASAARDHQNIGNSRFLQRQVVFNRKKDLYLPQGTLKLRCRLWKREGDVDEFGQSFGRTRFEMECVRAVEHINPRINKEKTIFLHSKRQKILLISIDVSQKRGGLNIILHATKNNSKRFSTFKFLAEAGDRKIYEFSTSWWVRPCKKEWTHGLPIIGTKFKLYKLRLTCEFIYSTGKETKSIENVSPCSFKFPEFTTNCILSCVSSGKLSDCRNIYTDLWDLCAKRILCDVELKTQTTSFWVHKTVLCARSLIFSTMFNIDMKEKMTNCVVIEDLEDNTLEKLLKFLYTDSFEETQWDALVELYYSADKYQIARLKKLCCSYFRDKIDAQNVNELLTMAERYNDSDLKSEVDDYIARNHEKIFKLSIWNQFFDKQPLSATQTRIFGFKTEREKGKRVEARKLSSYPSAMDDFKSLYRIQTGSDIVIQTTTATFPAHKTILCAGSSILREMFISGKSTDSLKVEDMEDDTASHLLLFLYTDSLGDTKWEEVTKLYHAAVAYQIERLKLKCLCFFLENLNASNASNLLELAHEHRDVRLNSLVKDFISFRDREIWDYEILKKLDNTNSTKRIETRPSKRLRLK